MLGFVVAWLVVVMLLFGHGSKGGDAHILSYAWTDLAVDRLIE